MRAFSKMGLIPSLRGMHSFLIRNRFLIRKENKTLRCFFPPINMFRAYFFNGGDAVFGYFYLGLILSKFPIIPS